MNKLKHKEHDFSSKLRQISVVDNLKKYISWQRENTSGNGKAIPSFAPVSINLDITSACNFACPHCVDSKIINTGEFLDLELLKQSLDFMVSKGLLSIILLGGGEPTLYRDFEEIVRHIKSRKLQLGIVTNGSRMDRVKNIADVLGKEDWVRLSIDAAQEETFIKSHCPRISITLEEIMHKASEVKKQNPSISLGYSYVVVWDELLFNGHELCSNVHEMAGAVENAKKYGFDYVSFKPCLLRLAKSQKESLIDGVSKKKELEIIESIKKNLNAAKSSADGQIRILESINLRALLSGTVHELKRQPKICHMQFFSSVLCPSGVFHCPAFRGVDVARIAGCDAFSDENNFSETLTRLQESMSSFDASKECSVVACFYHHVNWWIEDFITSRRDINEIDSVSDDNFFL